MQFQKSFVEFEINTLEFFKNTKFYSKYENFNIGNKNVLFDYFPVRNLKKLLPYLKLTT